MPTDPVHSLEAIAQADGVDAAYHMRFLAKRMLVSGIASIASGIGLIVFGSDMSDNHSIGAGAGLLLAGGIGTTGWHGMKRGGRVLLDYPHDVAYGTSEGKNFYFINGRVSGIATVVEREYGMPIRVLRSLNDLDSLSHRLAGSEIVFLNGLWIENVTQHNFLHETWVADSDGASSIDVTPVYTGSFVLRRGDEQKEIGY